MNDVFLSYAREDREVVEQLAAAIDDAGLAVWWDKNIEPGTRFDKVLENELHKSRCVVVAWSQNSIDSDWVCSEAHEGFERGKGTGHGSPWPYDRQVPVVFAGPGVANTSSTEPLAQDRVAATLCKMLGIPPPNQLRTIQPLPGS